ncbi:type II toxin-antitoxin system HicA family toxin [Chitinophaga japonensis]|uniref:Putative RNA binding protein YcfA (HicA-like mRNA interferase family) n=1 Tax=Chitinophaga japonensis TaxID=104662 RepID=A0A562SS61_CHIJA|nr:type II toxin-antitoxin system HicA family toxin [Chitinophaga japonensis]TWI84099.1 putative RNA binding protein YcfA (HicA-like mRNA interferase family) [Chitinophaga japonensis]
MHFKEVLSILKKDGWIIKVQKGSHIQLVHPTKPKKVTVPAHGKKDIPPGTLNEIWKQAGLK